MNSDLEIAVLVSSFQRPWHLERVLLSLACQRHFQGRFEVVVTDDGSGDGTADMVRRFAESSPFPLTMTTHPHDGFQLARCRNEGVFASHAPYLLFLDGDCLVPPDHLYQHWRHRRPGVVRAGYCCLLDQATTERIGRDDVKSGQFCDWATEAERKKLAKMARRARVYNWIRHPTKPKLYGGNVGIFRVDYERLNGYDENFRGWGCEDDDLRLRARAAGMQVKSILQATCTYHLWHPRGETTPDQWREGANVAYLRRKHRPARCERGLSQYDDGDRPVCIQRFDARPLSPQADIPAADSHRADSRRADAKLRIGLDPIARSA